MAMCGVQPSTPAQMAAAVRCVPTVLWLQASMIWPVSFPDWPRNGTLRKWHTDAPRGDLRHQTQSLVAVRKGHEWCVSIQSRTLDGTGCPVCAGRVILPGENDMASQFPGIAQEWHPTKMALCCRPRSRPPANGGSGGAVPWDMNMWPQWGCGPCGTPVVPTVPGKKSWPGLTTCLRWSRKSRRSGIPH